MKKLFTTTAFILAIFVGKAQVLVSENFTPLTFPPTGWGISTTLSSAFTWKRSTTPTGTSGQAYVEAVENVNYNEGLYTPLLNLVSGDVVQINFNYEKTVATGGTLKLVSSPTQSNATHTVLQNISMVTNANTAHSFTYTVSTTGNFAIGFLYQDFFTSGFTLMAIDNIIITKLPPLPTQCTGTPPAGISSGPASDGYTENGITLTHTNPSTMPGYTYQWQKQLPNLTWVNLTGAGNTELIMYNVIQEATTSYRMMTTCTNSSLSTFSAGFTTTTPIPAYATLPITEYFETPWLNINATKDAPNTFSKTVPSSGQRSARRNDDPGTTNTANWLSPNYGAAGIVPYQGNYCARFHSTAAFFVPNSYFDTHFNGEPSQYKRIIYLENGAGQGDALIPQLSINGGKTFTDLPITKIQAVGSAGWVRKTIDFTAISNICIFRLKVVNNDLPGNPSDIFLDSLAIFNIPVCNVLPTNIEVLWQQSFTTCASTTYTTPATVCAFKSINIRSNNLPEAEGGLSWVWQKATAGSGGVFLNIIGSEEKDVLNVTITEDAVFRLLLTCTASGNSQESNNSIIAFLAPSSECFNNTNPFAATTIAQQEGGTITQTYFNNKHAETQAGNIVLGCNWPNMNRNLWYQFTAMAPTVNINLANLIATEGALNSVNYSLYKSISSVYSGNTVDCGTLNTTAGTALQTISGLTVGTIYFLRLGMPTCSNALSGQIWATVPNVALTPANTCTPATTININATLGNNNQWVGIYYLNPSNIVAEIQANSNDLDAVTTSVYRNTNALRRMNNGLAYLDRNVQISVALQPAPGSPVGVRIYITKAEYETLRDAPVSGVTSLNDLLITKLSNNCAGAISSGGTILSATTGLNGTNYFIEYNVTSFSTFYIHGTSTLLPIKLQAFTANAYENYNQLNWLVNSAINFKQFDVESSTDGNNFTKITTVINANIAQYTYKDFTANGTMYYRLKMIDNNGSYTYSTIVKCSYKNYNKSYLLQNPVQATLTIKRNEINNVTNNATTNVTLTIYNNIGQQVMQTTTNNMQIVLNVNTLPAGIYTCTLTTKRNTQQLKFIKQ